VLIGAAYSFLGTEILGMTAAEIKNPTKNIPRAIRGVWVRILLFYMLVQLSFVSNLIFVLTIAF
jgi:yeast amino acid transporter